MEVGGTLSIAVAEATQVGDARRQVVRLAESLGLGETVTGRLALVATELAGNLVKHTGAGGELLIRALERDGVHGVELMALDRGAGIADVGRALRDGFSTAGSPGTGLGAVGRLSDLFQLDTRDGQGTALLSQVWNEALPGAEERGLWVGAVSVPKPGQEVCGDGWARVHRPGGVVVLVADGLGHGPGAAEASREAIRNFLAAPAGRSPGEHLEALHRALRGTRGAAVAVAEVDAGRGVVRFAGVGNIAGSVHTGAEARSVVSHNGIVGHEMRRVQEFEYPWVAGSTLILHSDGIQTRWDLERFPGLGNRHPSLVAGVLYREFARGNDDATVAVVREALGPATPPREP